MDTKRIQEIHKLIKNHQQAVQKNVYADHPRPAGAGLDSDDLSKVASVESINKAGEPTLRK